MLSLLLTLLLGLGFAAASPEGFSLEPSVCPTPVPVELGRSIDCGYIQVPERHDLPDGAQIRLPYAHLRADVWGADPLLVLVPGGPGGSAMETVRDWVTSPFLNLWDLIFIEQRGAPYASPSLRCAQLQATLIETYGMRLRDEDAFRLEQDAALRCYDDLAGQGIDIRAYNSLESARDLEALRQALGYRQWNLYGASYGSHVALTLMQLHPETIRSVILDAPVLPQLAPDDYPLPPSLAIEGLLEACALEPDCRDGYPNLRRDLLGLVEQLGTQPQRLETFHPRTGAPFMVVLDADRFLTLLYNGLYSDLTARVLPLIVHNAAQGRFDLMAPLVQVTLEGYERRSLGLFLAVRCQEGLRFYDPQTPRLTLGGETLETLRFSPAFDAFCDTWGLTAADLPEVRSFIPTLVLSGASDPNTPPGWGAELAEPLPNSFYFEFAGLGHGLIRRECPQRVALDFLRRPRRLPDTPCPQDDPVFLTGRDLHVTPAVYRMGLRLLRQDDRIQIGLLLYFVFSFLFTLLLPPLYALVRRRFSRTGSPLAFLAGSLSALIALVNLGYLTGLGYYMVTLDPLVLAFGLPLEAWRVLLLAPMSLALSLSLVATFVYGLRRDRLRGFRRYFYLGSSLNSSLFILWLLYARLFILPL